MERKAVMTITNSKRLFLMILSAMFIALAIVLPFLTGQIPQIGNALCPMHIPILLCGFLCGPWYGLIAGLIAPALRFILFGMPPFPKVIALCFELGTYGVVAGGLYRLLPKRNLYIYVSLIVSMFLGRVVWGIARVILYGFGGSEFSWAAFIAGGFVTSLPGIFVQFLVIPVLVIALKRIRITDTIQTDNQKAEKKELSRN